MSKLRYLIKRNLGVYYMIISCLILSLVGCCAKILSESLPSIEVVFFRNLVGLFFILYLIYKLPHIKAGGKFWLLFSRGFFGTVALYLFFYTISNISLGLAFVFQQTSPLFVVIIAFVLFREKISLLGIICLITAFMGVILIALPSINNISTELDFKNISLGIFSGFCAAIALTSARQLGKFYNAEIIALSFISLGVIMPSISLVLGEYLDATTLAKYDFAFAKFVMPNNIITWILILLMGFFSCLFQVYVAKSYRMAKRAGIVAGLSYIDVIFALILGIILGDSIPSFIVLVGMFMVLSGGIAISVLKVAK